MQNTNLYKRNLIEIFKFEGLFCRFAKKYNSTIRMKFTKLLPIFSYIFHPIFISFFGTLTYFGITHSFFYKNQMLLIGIQVLILTVLLPLSLYFLLKSIGKVTSFSEADIQQRKLPVLIQAFLLYLLFYRSTSLEITPELYSFFQGGFWCAIVAFALLLFRIKASLHMMGIVSFVVFATFLSVKYYTSIGYFFIGILLIGLVASSRLYMKAHTPVELLLGGLVGAITQVSIIYLLKFN